MGKCQIFYSYHIQIRPVQVSSLAKKEMLTYVSKISLYLIVRVISVKFISLTIRGTHTCLTILFIETTLFWKLRVH